MKRARQSAPAELSQECVKEALEAFMKKSGSRDLAKLLQPLKSTATWKNAPSQCIPALCGLEDLFVEILKRCPSGVLPPKKNRSGSDELQQGFPLQPYAVGRACFRRQDVNPDPRWLE